MKKFNFYDFAGILVPGAVLLFGLSILFSIGDVLNTAKEFSVGELGLFSILSYAAGHIVQALGNVIEDVWWKFAGGMPSDWLRTQRRELLAAAQRQALREHLLEHIKTQLPADLSQLSKGDWYAITREIFANVKRAGLSERIDIFSGIYGMFRGLSASLLSLLIAYVFLAWPPNWWLVGVLTVVTSLCLIRMHRFGVTYAREIFVQFLAIEAGDGVKPSSNEEEE